MPSSGMLRRVALVSTDVSEELSASNVRVRRISELGTLAVTSNRRTLWFLQQPYEVTSQKTAFFIVTAVKTSNLTDETLFSPAFQCRYNVAASHHLVLGHLRVSFLQILPLRSPFGMLALCTQTLQLFLL
jgi:hypothetical protein